MKNKKYICADCGREFEGGWSDEEALEESRCLFSKAWEAGHPMVVVCDDCFRKIYKEDMVQELTRT